jgi:hypothetical protein
MPAEGGSNGHATAPAPGRSERSSPCSTRRPAREATTSERAPQEAHACHALPLSQRQQSSRTPASFPHPPASSTLCGAVNLCCSEESRHSARSRRRDGSLFRERERLAARRHDAAPDPVRPRDAGRLYRLPSTPIQGSRGGNGEPRQQAMATQLRVSRRGQSRGSETCRSERPSGWPVNDVGSSVPRPPMVLIVHGLRQGSAICVTDPRAYSSSRQMPSWRCSSSSFPRPQESASTISMCGIRASSAAG